MALPKRLEPSPERSFGSDVRLMLRSARCPVTPSDAEDPVVSDASPQTGPPCIRAGVEEVCSSVSHARSRPDRKGAGMEGGRPTASGLTSLIAGEGAPMSASEPNLSVRSRARTRPLASFLLPNLKVGGGQRTSISLARELLELGMDVELVVGQADGPLMSEVPAGLPVFELRSSSLLGAAVPLLRYLRSRRPGCLVPTLEQANVLALLAGGLTRTPVVVRVANTLSVMGDSVSSARDQLTFGLARRLYRRSDALVACSDGLAEDLSSWCDLPRSRVEVIPNPTVAGLVARAREPLDHPWFQPREPPVVLAVGRLAEHKNFPLLLDAFSLVRRRTPARLVVLGEGPDRAALERHVTDLGLQDVASLPGMDPNPYRYMARAAVFVLASNGEGLPGVLIEALACGCEIVSTDCPRGARAILREERFGELVPTGDPEALAEAVIRRLHSREHRDPATRRDPLAMLQTYHAAGVAQCYLEVLQRVGR